MADAIIYCDRCGRIILPSDMAAGEAIVAETLAICRSCAKGLSPEERKAVEAALKSRAAATSSAPKVALVPRPEPARVQKRTHTPIALMFGVGLGAGALVAVAIGLLVRSSRPQGRGMPVQPPASIMAVTPREPVPMFLPQETNEKPQPSDRALVNPVQTRLAELRELAARAPSRLEELRREVERFSAEFKDTAEADEARRLLREAEERYLEQAEGALKVALDAAEKLLAEGRYDDALRAFSYVRMQFGESTWFREKAEPAIAAIQKRIEEAKTKFTREGVSIQEDFSGFADGPFASPAWTVRGNFMVSGGVLIAEARESALAVLNVPEADKLVFEAVVSPRQRVGPGWAMAGIVLWKDDANFWSFTLVEAQDGPKYLELNEMLEGKWMAQLNEAKLTVLENKLCGLVYGHRYRFRLELMPDSIVGSVRDLDGQEEGRVAYKFDNRAVRSGRPALRVVACRAEFDDISGTVGVAQGAVAPKPPEPGQGYVNGLLGEYFKGRDPIGEDLVLKRVDAQIDFDWGLDIPAEGVPADNFSVRWTGELFIPSAGDYRFYLQHDDGVRLWVDGKLVIENWKTQVGNTTGLAQGLSAGWRSIKLEFFDSGREARVKFFWMPPWVTTSASLVPKEYLRTPLLPAASDAMGQKPAPAGLPPNAREFSGRWYAYIPESGNWYFAKRRCEEMGGHLVTITSREENEFVATLLRSSAWIGFTDEGHEGRWEWVTGESSAFTAWARGEPSGGDENYAEMRSNSPPEASWNDLKSDANLPGFVCEWEPEVLRLASPADANARPEIDGYSLQVSILSNLSRRRGAAKPVAKRIAAIGGVLATSTTFDQVLRKELPPQEGYSIASKIGLASTGLVLTAARKAVEKALEREKPEVVRICFDAGALRDGRGQAAWRIDLAAIVEEVFDAGAVPILFTLSVPRPQDARALDLVEGFNKVVKEVAAEKLVPWVDAYGLLNADMSASFNRDGSLKAAAVQMVAERFIRLYRIIERAVLEREATVPEAKPAPAAPQGRQGARRVEKGLAALWLFSEGTGAVVRDRSGTGAPIELRAKDLANIRWLAPQGLEFIGPTVLASETSASNLVERIKASGRFSVEVWFEPANLSQSGPARIISLSQDTMNRDFTLGQAGLELVFRLRTSLTNPNGIPELQTRGLAMPGGPVHVVATFDGVRVRLYVNGREREERHEPGGDLSSWQAFPILIGNELTGDRPWLGKIYLAAIYDRALSAEEVLQNYNSGFRL